jgi:hypothetical protein
MQVTNRMARRSVPPFTAVRPSLLHPCWSPLAFSPDLLTGEKPRGQGQKTTGETYPAAPKPARRQAREYPSILTRTSDSPKDVSVVT